MRRRGDEKRLGRYARPGSGSLEGHVIPSMLKSKVFLLKISFCFKATRINVTKKDALFYCC